MVSDHQRYQELDALYTALDRTHIRRTRNIRLIPSEANRRGGKYSYAEWAHVIGIFQTLMNVHLEQKESNWILDVGCGTGLMGIAGEPFLGPDGRYVGIDVAARDIEFCRSHYPAETFEFIHLDINNPAYAPAQSGKGVKWPLANARFDLVTALSVWTHMNQEDALFYFREVNRVLKPDGISIITFFLLDGQYENSLATRTNAPGRYHMTSQEKWVFDQAAYGSDGWFSPKWAKVPEEAIGLTTQALESLTFSTEMRPVAHYPGNWKEVPGVFFQDVLIFKKTP
jgi:SAM-dependent methyltransferase